MRRGVQDKDRDRDEEKAEARRPQVAPAPYPHPHPHPDPSPSVVLDPRGAAFFPDSGTLAVADLHVGYEAAHHARGVALPRQELEVLLPLLDGLLDRHRPDVVVLDGDVKHAFGRTLAAETDALRALWRRLAARARVVVVEGNHDAGLRAALPDAEVVPSHREGRVVFAHGHAAAGVEAGPMDTLVLGHEHPAVTLRDAVGAAVRAPAFLRRDGARGRRGVLVLPALGPWAAGYDALRPDAFMSPLLARHDRGDYRALVASGEEVLDFGEIRRLRRVMSSR